MKDWDVNLFKVCCTPNRLPNNVEHTQKILTHGKRNKEMFMMRHALGTYSERHNYKDIGEAFGISGTRVICIITKIERRLKHPDNKELREYLSQFM